MMSKDKKKWVEKLNEIVRVLATFEVSCNDCGVNRGEVAVARKILDSAVSRMMFN